MTHSRALVLSRIVGRFLGALALALPLAYCFFQLARANDTGTNLLLEVNQGQAVLRLPKLPGNNAFQIQKADAIGLPWTLRTNGLEAYTWSEPAGAKSGFYAVTPLPMASNTLLTSIVLNRLGYGPTPDEIDRVLTGTQAIGPEAYIREQLEPENIAENLDQSPANLDWQFVSITGTASSSKLYIYIDTAGQVFLDDLSLVAGSVAGVGANLIPNGNFEAPLGTNWTVAANLTNSTVSTEKHHGGASSLKVVTTSGGSTAASALVHDFVPTLKNGQTYTLSYWYLPSTSGNNLSVRLSGSASVTTPIDTTHGLVPAAYQPGAIYSRLSAGQATPDDLRAWYILHAVRSQKQLFEVLTQFVDNHLTTQYTKSRDWVNGLITNTLTMTQVATDFEFREISKWRTVLANPQGSFLDLLKISAESPAMIIYLDTVTSSSTAPNENYSRELMELFTMGVDNGYDQGDIEEMSRAWTGWRVDKLPLAQETNPFATPVANRETDPGYWTLRFRTDRHDTKAKSIFNGKTVDARFGPRWAGKSYQLDLPARTGNAGMQDGYDIVAHLSTLPYTMEYISVKLCRLLVHEQFLHGTYDYSDPASLSPEGRLIYDCMVAWDTPASDGRKGNLRKVLSVIFGSDLFRGTKASQQKLRTPLEFVVSTVRALRAAKPGGGFTADTDGFDTLTTIRRLNMKIFDRTDPDGWSEFGRDWISTAAMVERMRYVQNFVMSQRNPLKAVDFGTTGDDNVCDPVTLLKQRLPSTQWRDARKVADLFLGLIYLGEGRANLGPDRDAAIAYLNSNDTGTPNSSPFSSLDPATSAYDERVRSMVAMVMGLPRFEEQ